MKRQQLTNGHLVDLVLAARDRIADAWTTGAEARRTPDPEARRTARFKGASTHPLRDDAVAWCMVGAVKVEAPHGWRNRRIVEVIQAAFDDSGLLKHHRGGVPLHIQSFNDSGTQDRAVGAFDELARWLKDTGWEPPPDEVSS